MNGGVIGTSNFSTLHIACACEGAGGEEGRGGLVWCVEYRHSGACVHLHPCVYEYVRKCVRVGSCSVYLLVCSLFTACAHVCFAFASSYHFWIPAQVCTTSHKGCNAQPRSPPPPVKCGVRAVGSGRIVEITGITITITIIEVTLASISVYIQWEGEKKAGRKEG